MNLANWARYGLAATLATAAGSVLFYNRQADSRQRDAAPARSARRARHCDGYRVTGAVVSIRATAEQIIDCWQSNAELWSKLEYLPFPEGNQPDLLLPPAELRDMASLPMLIRIGTTRPGELIAWRSEGEGFADMHGRLNLNDNGSKGMAVEVTMAVRPPDFGSALKTEAMMAEALELGLLRDLRRLKMLIEAGEIATAKMRPDAA